MECPSRGNVHVQRILPGSNEHHNDDHNDDHDDDDHHHKHHKFIDYHNC